MSETVGQRIKAARKTRGLTLKQVAEKMPTTYQTLAQWENDLRNPKIETLHKIAAAIGCPMSEITDEVVEQEHKGYRVTISCDGHARLYTPIEREDAS